MSCHRTFRFVAAALATLLKVAPPYLAVAAAAMASTIATADITNGSFSNGSEGWTQFGGSEGPYDVGFFGGNAAVVAYGTFGGTPNYSGYTQDLGVAGDYAEGDILEDIDQALATVA